MRKVLLYLLVLLAFKSSQAQQTNATIQKPMVIIPDTSIVVSSFPKFNGIKSTNENMPNPLLGMDNQLTKIGSNNIGFDMYQSKQDNMIVLKPDTLNLASNYIPNGLNGLPIIPKKLELKGLAKLNALVDSLNNSKKIPVF